VVHDMTEPLAYISWAAAAPFGSSNVE